MPGQSRLFSHPELCPLGFPRSRHPSQGMLAGGSWASRCARMGCLKIPGCLLISVGVVGFLGASVLPGSSSSTLRPGLSVRGVPHAVCSPHPPTKDRSTGDVRRCSFSCPQWSDWVWKQVRRSRQAMQITLMEKVYRCYSRNTLMKIQSGLQKK